MTRWLLLISGLVDLLLVPPLAFVTTVSTGPARESYGSMAGGAFTSGLVVLGLAWVIALLERS